MLLNVSFIRKVDYNWILGCGIDDDCLANQFCRDVSHTKVSQIEIFLKMNFAWFKFSRFFVYWGNILGSLWSESSGSLSRQWTKIFRWNRWRSFYRNGCRHLKKWNIVSGEIPHGHGVLYFAEAPSKQQYEGIFFSLKMSVW